MAERLTPIEDIPGFPENKLQGKAAYYDAAFPLI
jgi:hypothetical protein